VVTVAQENNMAKKKIVEPVVENPWKKIGDMVESLYISIDEQYKVLPKNELSSMLVMLSLVNKTIKQEHNVWESRK
jgi:hypothetical protein